MLLVEDSCHYLFFSLIFLYVQPFILILFPVVLFAVLHSASYSLKLLDVSITCPNARNSRKFACGTRRNYKLTTVAVHLTPTLFSLFADVGSEQLVGRTFNDFIGGIPATQHLEIDRILRDFPHAFRHRFRLHVSLDLLWLEFSDLYVTNRGRAGLMTPFIYYHFLTLRYTSRRNPHTRNMFHDLKLKVESIASNPKAPPIIGNVLRKAIALVTRLAPPIPPQAQ